VAEPHGPGVPSRGPSPAQATSRSSTSTSSRGTSRRASSSASHSPTVWIRAIVLPEPPPEAPRGAGTLPGPARTAVRAVADILEHVSRLIVRPSGPLSGEVVIRGAKNSVLKLMAACVLATGRYVLRNVPHISDVEHMRLLLEAMGIQTRWRDDDALEVVRGDEVTPEAPYELVERMRASSAVLGPLLASVGEARVAMPGGDDFGSRPIDMHLQGLEAMGARFSLAHGVIEGVAPRLKGTEIVLEYPSVGATENLLMAGVLAEGRTTVHNAAREPEIADLAAFLNRMGGRILGAGSSVITIDGVDELRAVEHRVIPDRVEVATFLSALGV